MIARPERRPGNAESGFTLIELMIALVLFALISVAGLALVDSVLGVQGRTEARLDRLAELQRTMLVVTSDVEQVANGDIAGGGDRLTFTRAAPGLGGASVAVTYLLRDGVLTRSVGGRTQALLTGVNGARWRFFGDSWANQWPVSADGEDAAAAWPRAIALEVTVAPGRGPAGALRRVILLPARATAVTS
ncbi:PulJ/GspJ family protein [Sphingomonas sp.]|uniref:PulJ/GspJ family protein n=1 Tax=Sphingomonas sp. TaxID=28214 RepID=UPI002C04D169|nr:prepilin-type N-terminal cleavage/methylation domain-containing protein [Sphingomonas sp.]HWK35625.1 prepilin-type N-terminal cleavage/methylation domain-containing protein [Sphingomonas sp.]